MYRRSGELAKRMDENKTQIEALRRRLNIQNYEHHLAINAETDYQDALNAVPFPYPLDRLTTRGLSRFQAGELVALAAKAKANPWDSYRVDGRARAALHNAGYIQYGRGWGVIYREYFDITPAGLALLLECAPQPGGTADELPTA